MTIHRLLSVCVATLWLSNTLAEMDVPAVESAMDENSIKITGLEEKALRTGDPTPEIDNNQPTLYGMRFCPWCERVLLVAAKKGIDLRMVNINLKDKPEWFTLKHPDGKVPALELERQTILDSAIIPEFLDDKYPSNRVLPDDPFAKAQMKMLASKLETIMPKAFYAIIEILRDPSTKEQKQSEMRRYLMEAEHLLENKGYFYAGEKPGFPDYLTIPFLERIFVLSHHKSKITGLSTDDFPGNKEYPSLTRWFWKMSQLPEYEKISQSVDNQLKWFDGYVAGKPNYDVGLE